MVKYLVAPGDVEDFYKDMIERTQFPLPFEKPRIAEKLFFLLYDVEIPREMKAERMSHLCIIARLAAINASNRNIRQGKVSKYIFEKMCYNETVGRRKGSVDDMKKAVRQAGTYLVRIAQTSHDDELKLVSKVWFRRYEDYGMESFDPEKVLIEEAADFRGHERRYEKWSSKVPAKPAK